MFSFSDQRSIHVATLSLVVLADRRERGVSLENSSDRDGGHTDRQTTSSHPAPSRARRTLTSDTTSRGRYTRISAPLYRAHAELISQYLAASGIINASALGSVKILQIAHRPRHRLAPTVNKLAA